MVADGIAVPTTERVSFFRQSGIRSTLISSLNSFKYLTLWQSKYTPGLNQTSERQPLPTHSFLNHPNLCPSSLFLEIPLSPYAPFYITHVAFIAPLFTCRLTSHTSLARRLSCRGSPLHASLPQHPSNHPMSKQLKAAPD